MNEPQGIHIARRGRLAIAALVLTNTDGNAVLHAFSFENEAVGTAAQKALRMLGVPEDAQLRITVSISDIPESTSDEQVIARFAAAVHAEDVPYFYSLVSSKRGQA